MQPGQVLFSRYEHGTRPVKVLENGWSVEGLGVFTTDKGLLAALTGHPKGRHWSVERYFRIGPKHGSRPVLMDTDVLDILRTTPRPRTPPPVRTGLGIDLDKRSHEVRKLLFAGFGRRMFLSGYDPEDVLQEVYKGLLVRNSGKCPFDPSKSSFGHYVHMVASCVLSNYHRKHHRIQQVEQVGLPSAEAEDTGHRHADVASNTTVPAPPTQCAEDALVHEAAADLTDYLMDCDTTVDNHVATKIIPLILAGVTRDRLAPTLGISNAAITRALAHLRKHAGAWRDSLFQDALPA